jgi:hypothetical protein
MRRPNLPEQIKDKLRMAAFISIIIVLFNHSATYEIAYQGRMLRLNETWAEFILFLGQGAMGRVNRVVFFMVSGYLFFWTLQPELKAFLAKWRKRITSLVLPFLIWSGLSVAMFSLAVALPGGRALLASREGFDGGDFRQLIDLWLVTPIPYQFWYIRDLCGYILLSPLIYWLALRMGRFLVAVMLGLWVVGQGLLDMAPSGLCFFTIGAVMAVKGVVPNWDLRKRGRWALWIWVGVCFCYTLLHINRVEMPALMRIGSLFGLVAVWWLLDLIPLSARSWLLKHAPFTFFVFALHEPMMSGIRKVFFLAFPLNGVGAVAIFLLLPWLVLAICLKCGRWVKTKLPKVYPILSGGRG